MTPYPQIPRIRELAALVADQGAAKLAYVYRAIASITYGTDVSVLVKTSIA
jgi:hypothetical protein